MSDNMDLMELVKAELNDESYEVVIAGAGRIELVAIGLGPDRTREELLPFLKDFSQSDNDEANAAIAKQLGLFVDLVGGPNHASEVLNLLEVFAMLEETVIRDAVIESFNNVCKQCNKEMLAEKVVPIVKRLSEHDWLGSRIVAAGTLASVLPSLDDEDQEEACNWYTRLCNDEVPMVRISSYNRIQSIANSLPVDMVKTHLVPIAKNLYIDEMENIRICAVNVCVALVKVLDANDSNEIVRPLLESLSKDTSWKIRQAMAKALPKLTEISYGTSLHNSLLHIVIVLLQDAEPSVKLSVGEVITDVVSPQNKEEKSADALTPIDEIATMLQPHLETFVSDENERVRITLCEALPKLCAAYDNSLAESKLVPLVLALTKDEVADVRRIMICNLKNIVESVGEDCVVSKIVPLLSDLSKDTKWRVRLEVVSQVQNLSQKLGQDIFDKKLSFIIMAGLTDHVFAIRENACGQVAALIKLWGIDWASAQILPNCMDLYKASTNYLHRMTALSVVKSSCNLMSSEQIQKYVLPTCLLSCKDEVSNVRFFAAKVIMNVCPLLDKSVLTDEVEPVLKSMLPDDDVDVQYFASEALRVCSECTAA